jgi:SagB-type dehydrogenase family enzyme
LGRRESLVAITKGVTKQKRAKPKVRRYRRSPFLISYWEDDRLHFHNYLSGKVTAVSGETAEVLDFFDNWQTLEAMARRWPQYSAKSLRATLEQLTKQTLLESSTAQKAKEVEKARALQKWNAWNPAAGFFHFSTKDAYSQEISKNEIAYFGNLMGSHKLPRPAKYYPSARALELRSEPSTAEFSRVLRERRTWREFSPDEVSSESFASLMELSFAVQQWEKIPKVGKLAQKTSPSGGSLHPLEAYVVALKVKGVAPGIYHYDSIGRKLQEVRRGVTPREVEELLAGQWWYRDAAFVVFLTAVFARTQWKYDYARAYRAILIEAGHLCQTFCLTATWLRLAPFCTIAMADTAIEKALKIDGISESVIYAMGAGVKPVPA